MLRCIGYLFNYPFNEFENLVKSLCTKVFSNFAHEIYTFDILLDAYIIVRYKWWIYLKLNFQSIKRNRHKAEK